MVATTRGGTRLPPHSCMFNEVAAMQHKIRLVRSRFGFKDKKGGTNLLIVTHGNRFGMTMGLTHKLSTG